MMRTQQLPDRAEDITWFKWAAVDGSIVLVRDDDSAVVVEPSGRSADMIEAITKSGCNDRIDEDRHWPVAVPVVDQQVCAIRAGSNQERKDVHAGNKSFLRSGDRLLE